MPLDQFMQMEKSLARFPGWSDPEPETDYIWFNAPVEVGGFVEAGLQLHGGTISTIPNQHVVFELQAYVPGYSKRKAVMRAEWRSLTGGHTSPRRSGVATSGERVGDTHLHPFDLNWSATERRMRRGNLRQAIAFGQEFQSFESFRDGVGIHFGISNIDIVLPPPWVYDLYAEDRTHG